MGFSDDPMGSLGCKGGAGRKPLEATARSLGEKQPSHLDIKDLVLTEKPE